MLNWLWQSLVAVALFGAGWLGWRNARLKQKSAQDTADRAEAEQAHTQSAAERLLKTQAVWQHKPAVDVQRRTDFEKP